MEEEINRVQPSQHYEQPAQLFWNCGAEQATEFLPMPAEKCGADLLRPLVGRGTSYADIDGDGDLDLVLTSIGGSPRLLRNDQQLNRHWLRLKLIGRGANRDAIGAKVTVRTDDHVMHRSVMPTRGYLSQVELPVTFGLGPNAAINEVRVTWPDGSNQTIDGVEIDRLTVIEQTTSAD